MRSWNICPESRRCCMIFGLASQIERPLDPLGHGGIVVGAVAASPGSRRRGRAVDRSRNPLGRDPGRCAPRPVPSSRVTYSASDHPAFLLGEIALDERGGRYRSSSSSLPLARASTSTSSMEPPAMPKPLWVAARLATTVRSLADFGRGRSRSSSCTAIKHVGRQGPWAWWSRSSPKDVARAQLRSRRRRRLGPEAPTDPLASKQT